MRQDVQALIKRLDDFSDELIDLVEKIPNTLVGRHIAGQLLRSGTSVPANYEEACGAESLNDFIHKMQIVLKETRESHFWLRKLARRGYPISEQAKVLVGTANEFVLIFSKSIITAKKKRSGG
ncbi:MAG: four helix bundle protein [Armatimonadota bacterium]